MNWESELDAGTLRALLAYDPDTGLFTWRRRRQGVHRSRGLRAGSPLGAGYLAITIKGRRYYSHRLAWLYIYGAWPARIIDHINRVKDDNRIVNLREADQTHNLGNSVRTDNATGHKGVYRYNHGVGFWAMVKYEGKNHYLGIFPTLPAAVAARRAKATELFGEFARH